MSVLIVSHQYQPFVMHTTQWQFNITFLINAARAGLAVDLSPASICSNTLDAANPGTTTLAGTGSALTDTVPSTTKG